MSSQTVAEILTLKFDDLTRAERQLALALQENYPVSGLGSITTIAQSAGVSTPTVARMVQKLGFKGFPEFQAALRQELEAKIAGPITKHDTWSESVPDAHILNRFTDAVIGNIRQSLGAIDPEAFDAACQLLADHDRAIFVAGGRITRALAEYFYLHFQVIRPRVTHIQSISNAWPHFVLDIAKGDVVVIFDVRRYETSTLKLAQMAQSRGAEVILFTDQWRSPVAEYAAHCFSNRIEVPSAWDSSVATVLLLETMISQVETLTWDTTRARMETLEGLFDETRLFRKFT